MSNQIIQEIEKQGMKEGRKSLTVGQTVVVSKYIVEGKKKRIQKFEGLVIGTQGKYSRESFTVRKIIDRVGVEQTFLLHSELIADIQSSKHGKVRRARLNYLRNRVGKKATRLKAKEAPSLNA